MIKHNTIKILVLKMVENQLFYWSLKKTPLERLSNVFGRSIWEILTTLKLIQQEKL